MIVSLNTKYIPLVQKPSCCNVTCLQMILYRRGFGLFDQQELAKHFDIKVGKDESKSFNVKLGTYTSTNCDEGLKTIESEKLINLFFKEKDIALTAKAVRASHIGDLKSFIVTNIKNDNDLSLKKIKSDLKDKTVLLMATKKNGKTIGFIRGYFESGIVSGIFWLQWLGVDAAYRRSGATNKMLYSLTKKLRAQYGTHKVVCVIRPKNNASVSLFKKNKYLKLAMLKKHWYGEDFTLWYRYL